MAPLHHHFEELGLKETKVVARFLYCVYYFGGAWTDDLKITLNLPPIHR